MQNETKEMLTRFIKFGTVSNELTRERIVEIIKDWEYIDPKYTNIPNRYLKFINEVILDKVINDILKKQPNIKKEIIEKLLKRLEEIESKTKLITCHKKGYEMLEKFKLIDNTQFIKFLKEKNKIKDFISSNYTRQELSVLQLKRDYNQVLKLYNNRKKRLKQEIITLENKNSSIYKEIENLKINIKKIRTQNLKIVGKIDLKTLKPVKYDNQINSRISIIEVNIIKLKEKINNNIEKISNFKDEIKRKVPCLDKIKTDFYTKWKDLIRYKKIEEELEIVEYEQRLFFKEIHNKIKKILEMLKLLSPFITGKQKIHNLWNLSKGNFQNVNFNELEKYAEILQNNKTLLELAKQLGKYRKAEIRYEEKEFEKSIITTYPKINYSGKSELVGVTESNDLNNLLPIELALFCDEETEDIFFKRYAEKKLQSYQFISKENISTSETIKGKRKKKIENEKGPFILAIDTSGSMNGKPEELAKIISFALTKVALKENRKVFLITFSIRTEVFELTDIENSLPKLISFLQMSFRGGTDATEAVKVAINQMKTKNYKKADLLIISDGDFGHLNSSVINSINILKKKDNKFNALMIGSKRNYPSLDFCNNIWEYNPRKENLEDLVFKINDIG